MRKIRGKERGREGEREGKESEREEERERREAEKEGGWRLFFSPSKVPSGFTPSGCKPILAEQSLQSGRQEWPHLAWGS